ncbi:SDR family NAD(P)-dependent oxidoreductase [Alkalicaulis satelles]|uniref:SDR family NAD(P)-dependent oxidoreductase n=1 Tax=Alkalicaulis satelles TaxID=2609175 RepID=A0A5M6ZGI4_9PROT|nr:SDR family NAD(P)-dependent oxidoreductase [Alkalicaulis satelles]KAA5803853.1 SDR family NAD(P)-dependent oxidoreductase [Alkalicaulis satelles]
MDLTGKTAIVTGAASGIGKAIATALHAHGARIAAIDLDGQGAEVTGASLGGLGAQVDVTDEAALTRFINRTERSLGPVDIYISNAGIGVTDGPGWGAGDAPNAAWQACWDVNVMASVYAARHLARKMAARGGHFLVTASAAGLLAQIGDAAYSATKAAAVSFAESLAITHGDDGLIVHCLCPEGVRTPLVEGVEGGAQGLSGYIEADEVAARVLEAMAEKRFLITTHANTAQYAALKGAERDRWAAGMRKLRRQVMAANDGRPM